MLNWKCLRIVGKVNKFSSSLSGRRRKLERGQGGPRRRTGVQTTLIWQFFWCPGDAWTLGGRQKYSYERKKIQGERLMSPGNSREHVGLLCGLGGELAFGRSLFSLWENITFYMFPTNIFLWPGSVAQSSCFLFIERYRAIFCTNLKMIMTYDFIIGQKKKNLRHNGWPKGPFVVVMVRLLVRTLFQMGNLNLRERVTLNSHLYFSGGLKENEGISSSVWRWYEICSVYAIVYVMEDWLNVGGKKRKSRKLVFYWERQRNIYTEWLVL